jgi:hypothetical protein
MRQICQHSTGVHYQLCSGVRHAPAVKMSRLLASGMHLCSYNTGLQLPCLLQVEGVAQGQVLHKPEDALAAVAAAEVRWRAVEVGGL